VPAALNTDVEAQVRVENGRARGRVELDNGERIDADIVCQQRRHRVDLPPPGRTTSTGAPGPTASIERARYSMSLFVWYFGTDRRYPTTVPHHVMVLGPRYEGLLHDIFKRTTWPRTSACTCTAPRDRPVDGAEGCDAFYVLSPVPHLDSGTDWARVAEATAARAARLERTVLPGWAGTSSARGCRRRRTSTTICCRSRAQASAWSHACCKAPGSARTTAAKT
jgi:phytoene desaturase